MHASRRRVPTRKIPPLGTDDSDPNASYAKRSEAERESMAYTVRHTIDTDVDTLWNLYFDEGLAREMLKSLGDVGGFEVVEDRLDEDGIKHRRVECWSNVELPSIAKKLIGDGAYTEIGAFDTRLKKYKAQCVPKQNADKFGTTFEVTLHPIDGGKRCEREIVVENKVTIFGIGGMVTTMLERVQRDSHEHSAKFLNEWLKSNPQTRPSTGRPDSQGASG